jgi:hypothetical protein
MDPVTKTYLALGLVFLAIFEYWAAMQIFGKKGKPGPHAKLVLRLHRIGGYVFLAYFMWISWICIEMMGRLANAGKPLDARGFFHGFLAMSLFGVLLVKISFVRFYRNYRPYVPLLGIVLSTGTLVLWGIAGWMFLILMGLRYSP